LNGSILLFGEFITDNGCFWSNNDFKSVYRVKTGVGHYDIAGLWTKGTTSAYHNPYRHKPKCEVCNAKKKVRHYHDWDLYLCRKCRREWIKDGVATEYAGHCNYAAKKIKNPVCPQCGQLLIQYDFDKGQCPYCRFDLAKKDSKEKVQYRCTDCHCVLTEEELMTGMCSICKTHFVPMRED
jgi:ribosomal protein S14